MDMDANPLERVLQLSHSPLRDAGALQRKRPPFGSRC
jgi:hypothetical protein